MTSAESAYRRSLPSLPATGALGYAGGRLTEVLWVAYRSLRKLSRNPFLLFFTLMMPIVWLGMFSQTFGTVFERAADLPGQAPPTYDYIAVLLPGIAVMSAIQSAAQSGFSMVSDIETGFMDKFLVAPISRGSVLIGKTLADGIRMAAQTAIVLAIAFVFTLVFGWRIPFATGVAGDAMIVLMTAGFGVAFAGLSNSVALFTKNTESTMAVSFTLTFPLLFLSTAMLPAGLLPPWLQTFSRFNPVSYVATASRSLILTGFDWTQIGQAFLAIAIVGVLLYALAVTAFRRQGR
ncbi:MAG TPA: ABC transporter permease [Thermoplasmata archaeon]|nr:ABC transporter permease [Thermoplasmata archaeon]